MRLHSALSALLASSIALGLAGCALQSSPVTPDAVLPSATHMTGKVFGGQQPVRKARIYLLSASTAGYGSSSVSDLTSGDGSDSIGYYVLTSDDIYGQFNLASDPCVPGTQGYILALGGNPGLSAGTNNAALALMANLGTCPVTGNYDSIPNVTINEVSTVAAVYSVAGYMTGPTAVASSGTALAATGLANAFATATNLVNLGTGFSRTTTLGGNGTVPQATVDTLANIIAACVNTNGAITPANAGTGAPASACYTLFVNSKNGSTTPADTVTALLNIAHIPAGTVPDTKNSSGVVTTPGNNTNLYTLATPSSPFQPSLGIQPNDFTLEIVYTGGGVGNPSGNNHEHNIAVDSKGRIWTANDSSSYAAEYTNLGAPLSGNGYTGNGLNKPYAVAIDTSDKVFLPNALSTPANTSTGTLSAFTAAGTPATGSPYTAGLGFDAAVDGANNVWTVYATNVAKYANSGTAATGSPFLQNSLTAANSVAIQPTTSASQVWVVDALAAGEFVFNNDGTVAAGSPYILNGADILLGNAIDNLGQVWTVDVSSSFVYIQTKTGAAVTGSPFTITDNPQAINAIAFDGLGNAWISDLGSTGTGAGQVHVLSPAGVSVSGTNGYAPNPKAGADSIAVDGSGNVWYTTARFDPAAPDPTFRELVGAAYPVVTPLATGLANNTLATRP